MLDPAWVDRKIGEIDDAFANPLPGTLSILLGELADHVETSGAILESLPFRTAADAAFAWRFSDARKHYHAGVPPLAALLRQQLDGGGSAGDK